MLLVLSEALFTELVGLCEEDQFKLLSTCSTIEFPSDNPTSRILLELLFYYIKFCLNSKFSFVQTSFLLEIIQSIFKICFRDCAVDQNKSAEFAISLFKEKLKSALTQGEVKLFDVNEVRELTLFFSNNIIKNYTAYEYVFSEVYEEREVVTCLNIGIPLAAPALMLGIQQ